MGRNPFPKNHNPLPRNLYAESLWNLWNLHLDEPLPPTKWGSIIWEKGCIYLHHLTPELGHRAERVAAMLVSTVSKREIPSHEVCEYMRMSNAQLLDMGKKWKEYVRISVRIEYPKRSKMWHDQHLRPLPGLAPNSSSMAKIHLHPITSATWTQF